MIIKEPHECEQIIAGDGSILRELLNPGQPVPDFEAIATTGSGVFDTLKAVAKLVLTELKRGG